MYFRLYPSKNNTIFHNFKINSDRLFVKDASNTTTIVITTNIAHSLVRNQKVVIIDVMGNLAANGVWYVDYVPTLTTVDLPSNTQDEIDEINENNRLFKFEIWKEIPEYDGSGDRVPSTGIPSVGNGTFSSANKGQICFPTKYSNQINTGKSPVLELRDGSSVSKVMLGFDIPDWLKDKLIANTFTCKLKMYDAGAQYDSMMPMKNIKLEYFKENFSEGNGWYFDTANGKYEVSNWDKNLENSLWEDVTFYNSYTYHLQSDNEDLLFDVTSSVNTDINTNQAFNYSLSVVDHQYDPNILTKFIWSRHTKTVFKPYLEFEINDTIKDDAYNLVAEKNNKVYFMNENGLDFNGAITAQVTLNNGNVSTLSSTKVKNGLYYVIIQPAEPQKVNIKEHVSVIWKIGSASVYKQVLEVKPNNQFVKLYNLDNVVFYPNSSYQSNVVRHGDIIPVKVNSQIRSKGNIVINTYKYRVVDSNGFEMIPWTDVSVYRDEMFFYINTLFFFPESNYEVFIKNEVGEFSITSHKTFKFKLKANDASHLRSLSASPYYNRETFFSK